MILVALWFAVMGIWPLDVMTGGLLDGVDIIVHLAGAVAALVMFWRAVESG